MLLPLLTPSVLPLSLCRSSRCSFREDDAESLRVALKELLGDGDGATLVRKSLPILLQMKRGEGAQGRCEWVREE